MITVKQMLASHSQLYVGPLSVKEQFVLQGLADGSEYADIAEGISSTRASIKNMAWRAMIKLGAETRTQAVALALRRRLIQ
jgi:DNA-binding NarL/FixJ family response regulator